MTWSSTQIHTLSVQMVFLIFPKANFDVMVSDLESWIQRNIAKNKNIKYSYQYLSFKKQFCFHTVYFACYNDQLRIAMHFYFLDRLIDIMNTPPPPKKNIYWLKHNRRGQLATSAI